MAYEENHKDRNMNKEHTTTAFFALTAALLLSPFAASAAETKAARAIELGAPFRDHAILQRDMDLPVWGWSKPGTTITVEFAGQNETGQTGADGKWLPKLKPLKTSAEPAEIEGNKAVVSFEKGSLFGRLMVGSKGLEKDSGDQRQTPLIQRKKEYQP